MRPAKENRMWRRLLFISLGLIFVIYGLAAIDRGHIATAHNWELHHTLFATKEPVAFWIMVSVTLLVGVVFIYRGIRGWK